MAATDIHLWQSMAYLKTKQNRYQRHAVVWNSFVFFFNIEKKKKEKRKKKERLPSIL